MLSRVVRRGEPTGMLGSGLDTSRTLRTDGGLLGESSRTVLMEGAEVSLDGVGSGTLGGISKDVLMGKSCCWRLGCKGCASKCCFDW